MNCARAGLPLNKGADGRWRHALAAAAAIAPVLLFVAFQMVSAVRHSDDGAFVGTCLLIITSNINVSANANGLECKYLRCL